MSHQNIGYVRVSTYHQNTDRQLHGVHLDKVFEEKVSGNVEQRAILSQCLDFIRDGDTLHVHSIDRLARNSRHLLNLVNQIVDKGARVKFHSENLEFSGDESPLAVLQLQMLAAFAEFNRSIINEARREGQERARAAGKRIGQPQKLNQKQKQEIYDLWLKREFHCATLAKKYKVGETTIYTAVKELRAKSAKEAVADER